MCFDFKSCVTSFVHFKFPISKGHFKFAQWMTFYIFLFTHFLSTVTSSIFQKHMKPPKNILSEHLADTLFFFSLEYVVDSTSIQRHSALTLYFLVCLLLPVCACVSLVTLVPCSLWWWRPGPSTLLMPQLCRVSTPSHTSLLKETLKISPSSLPVVLPSIYLLKSMTILFLCS